MKKKAAVVALLAVVTTVLVLALYPRSSGLEPVSKAEGQDLLAQVIEGRKKARAAIRSGKGTVKELVKWFSENGRCSEYRINYQIHFAGAQSKTTAGDAYQRDLPAAKTFKSKLKRVFMQIKPIPKVAGRGTIFDLYYGFSENTTRCCNGKMILDYNPRTAEVNIFESQDETPLPILHQPQVGVHDTVLDIGKKAEIKGTEVFRGNKCIVIEQKYMGCMCDGGMHTIIYWVCPKKGYSIVHMEDWSKYHKIKQKVLVSREDIAVREYEPGVWAPTRIETVKYNPLPAGRTYESERRVVTFDSKFKLNLPKSKLDLKLKLPKGTTVHDTINNRDYVVKQQETL